MGQFWFGFATAVGCYFGFGVGLTIVVTHLDRFHGGGFQFKRMAKHIGLVTLMWPMAIAEMLA